MGLIHKEKRADTISGSAQVYGRNTTHNVLNQRFSRSVLADFCATLRESKGNGENKTCNPRVVAGEVRLP